MSKYLAGKRPSTKDLNAWINFFHANGFLVIPNILKPEQCQLLRDDLEAAIKKTQGENYHPLKKKMMMKRMFEHSKNNLELFGLEPIVTFAASQFCKKPSDYKSGANITKPTFVGYGVS